MKQPDPFVIVPKFVIVEAPDAIGAYAAIRLFADYETGECYPAIPTIAKMLGVSRSTVERRIRTIVEIGAIEKTSRATSGETNLYRFPAARIGRHVMDDRGGTSPVTGGVRQERATNEEPSNDNHLSREEDAVRRRDFLWEIFVEIHGEPATKSERGKYNAILKKLREGNVEPDEYPTLVAAYTEKHGGLQPAPATVAERIGEMRHFRDRGAIRVARSVEERERDRRFAELSQRQGLREAGYEGDG